ncbi:MAG TPA: hypothetical protein PKK00_02220 [Bacteroidales bacterium]|nr:hypothetical protein [Bacteroidales bacterium]HPS15756.1 hypothetical protein [Bacteroidales bacterium]
MKRSYKYLFFIIAFFSIIFFSCKQKIENKIDGDWRMVDVNSMSTNTQEWTLMDGYIYMKKNTANSTFDTLSYGTYIIKIKRLTRYLKITECNNKYMVGEYKIMKLTNKHLELYRDENANYQYYEFIKK